MTGKIEFLINQLHQYEIEICNNKCQFFRSGISDAVVKIKQYLLSIDNDNIQRSRAVERVKELLEIEDTIKSWNGQTSCLGEEIEYFDATCKVFDYFSQIIKI